MKWNPNYSVDGHDLDGQTESPNCRTAELPKQSINRFSCVLSGFPLQFEMDCLDCVDYALEELSLDKSSFLGKYTPFSYTIKTMYDE